MFIFKVLQRALTLAAALGLPCALFCQSGKIPDSILLKTVVIQATRADAKNPVPHTNINEQTIAQNYQAQDMPFLLTAVPSLVESSDGGAMVGYTGMRIRGSDPTRINVTLNGVPLNDAESQGVFWVDLPDLAASAAEIQVQRGVGTSTNGPGAFGATVNIDLSKIDPEPYAILTNTFGSFNTRKHTAVFGTGLLPQKIAFSGRYSNIQSDGYIDRASVQLNALHLTGAYVDDRQSLQAQLLSGHEITYQAWNGVPAQFVDNPQLRTFNTAGAEKPGAPYEDEVDDYTQRHFFLHYKRVFDKGLNLQLNGHYTRGFGFYEQYKARQRMQDYGLQPLFLADTTLTETDLVRRRWLDNHFYGLTFALRWAPPVNPPQLSGAPAFWLGGALSRYEGRHFGEVIWAEIATAPKGHRYYDNDADKREGNVYLKLELPFRHGLYAFLDLQYRGVYYAFQGFDNDLNQVAQSVNLHFFNPKTGLSWRFAPKWSAHFFGGIANREPNRDDFTQSTPSSRPLPERLYDLETGIKTGNSIWSASLNIYWMYYQNQLALDGRINDVGAYIRTNIPNSYRAGLEIEWQIRAAERWQFAGNLAWSRNRIRNYTAFVDNWDTGGQDAVAYRNTDLSFSPAVVTRGELTWFVLKNRKGNDLSLSMSGKYTGKQFLDNTSNNHTRLPGYFFSDLRLNYDLKQISGKKISLILSINNLFDAHYSSNGWTYRYISGTYDDRPFNPYTRLEGNGIYNQTGFFPQAGRSVMATLSLHF